MAKKYLSPLNLLNLTSDPGTAAEGDFYWNSSTNRLRIYFDGAWADVSSNTAFTNAANTFTTAQTITPATSLTGLTINAAASAKGLIIKANATTPGNLQEWQNSAGTALAYFASNGQLYLTQHTSIIQGKGITWNNGDSYITGLSGYHIQFTTYDGTSGQNEAMRIMGGSIASGGARVGIGSTAPGSKLQVNTAATGEVGLIVRGAASQTANLTEWQGSDSITRSLVDPAARFHIRWSDAQLTTVGLAVSTYGSTTSIPIVVRGATSQTAHLQQWQDSAGTVLASIAPAGGLNISSSGTLLNIASSADEARIGWIRGASYSVRFGSIAGTAGSIEGVDTSTGTTTYQPLLLGGSTLILRTNNTTRLLVDGSGNVGIGTASPVSALQIGGGSTYRELTIMRNVDANGANVLIFKKSRGTEASPTATAIDDNLGYIYFSGHDGSTYNAFSLIQAQADGAPSSGSTPGRLLFLTTPSGSTTPVERMRISSNGLVTFANDVTVTGNLTVNGTTTNINTTNLVVEDKNIILGDVTTPSNTTADGGGITLKGATDKTFNWVNATGSWTSSEPIIANSFIPSSSTVPTNGMYLSAGNTLNFATNSTGGRLVIGSTGDVGIGGGASSGEVLHVQRSGTGSEVILGHFQNTGGGSAIATIKIGEGTPETQYGVLGHYGADNSFRIGAVSASAGYLSFHTGNIGSTNLSSGERMRIDASGRVGFAAAAGNDTSVLLGGTAVSATTSLFMYRNIQAVNSSVTSFAVGFENQANTQAASFTLGTYAGFRAQQGTFGAGSAVTNQSGFDADSSLIGATNNFGFRGRIAAGANRWNIFMDGTAANYLAGSTGIGTTSLTGSSLVVGKNITGDVFGTGIFSNGTVQSDVTTQARYFVTQASTAAATFTVPQLYHYVADQGTFGANSVVTNQYGFSVSSALTGATNNYAYYSALSAAANRYNIYMSGTAANYFAGQTAIGSAVYSMGNGGVAQMLGVTSSSATNIGAVIRGAASQTGDLIQWQNSAGTDLTSIDSGGSIRFNVNSAPMIKWGTATILEGVGSTASIRINPYGSTYIGLIVKGTASQSANLQEWQNSSGTAIGTMSASGAFTAITKSFDIPHPTKENMRLRYGSLEGPENGVYVRGRSKQDYIALPDHWRGLVDEDSITVNITPVGKKQKIYVDKIENNKIYLGGNVKEYFFTVYGERKDVDKLIVEY